MEFDSFLFWRKNEKLEGENEVIITHIKDFGLTYTRYIDLEIAAR